jgi:hypothetical protein
MDRGEKLKAGWNEPEGREMPKPTYWPAALAFAIVLIFWGPVTSIAMSAVGFAVAIVALHGWIGDIRRG